MNDKQWYKKTGHGPKMRSCKANMTIYSSSTISIINHYRKKWQWGGKCPHKKDEMPRYNVLTQFSKQTWLKQKRKSILPAVQAKT